MYLAALTLLFGRIRRAIGPAVALCVYFGFSPLAQGAWAAPALVRGVPPEIPLRDLVINQWTNDDTGLPSNTLTALAFHHKELWIASYNGVARFDGHTFQVYDHKTIPGLATNGFYEIVEGPNSRLWAGAQGGGLWAYRQGQFRGYAPEQLDSTVGSIFFDSAENLWVGNGGDGVLTEGPDGLIQPAIPLLQNIYVSAIHEFPLGTLWFGTDGRGLVRHGPEGDLVLTIDDGLPSNSINSFDVFDGALWIGTTSGIARWTPDGLETVPAAGPLNVDQIRHDDHGNLWIATEQGLVRRNALSGAFETLPNPFDRPAEAVSDIAFDHEGGLFFSSTSGGLFHLRPGRFTNYTLDDGLGAVRANIATELDAGQVLVGLDLGSLHLIEGDTVRPFPLHISLVKQRIRDIFRDSRGRLWIASHAGLTRLESTAAERPKTADRLFTVRDGLPANRVRVIHEDRQQNLWFGTAAGLVRSDPEGTLAPGTFEVFDTSSGLLSNFIFSIEETPDGNLLVGSHDGLNILEPSGRIITLRGGRDLPGSLVFNTFHDSEGTLWLATNNGLARLHQGRVATFLESDGLPAETLFDLAEDTHGHFWLSSSRGLVRIDRRRLNAFLDGHGAPPETLILDHQDGLANRECTGATRLTLDSQNRLWIPTLSGFSVFDPDRLTTNPIPPPVTIRSLVVDDEPIDLRSAMDSDRTVELPPGAKRYVFDFSALSYRTPAEVKVSYQLEGLDDQWIETRGERTAVYTSLPPGDYTFRVIAANDDGLWNREGASLKLRQRPRLHQIPAVRVAALLLFVGLGFALAQRRSRQIETRNRQLETMVQELQATELARQTLIGELEQHNEEMERFIYTVSHDLRSPLLTIRGFLGLVEQDVAQGRDGRVQNNIQRIDAAAVRMAELLDELLEISRIGRSANPPETVDLGALAREAVGSLAERIAERGVDVAVDDGLPTVVGDRPRLLEIFHNLVANAVKFMGDQPKPQIEISCRPFAEPVITVADNGIGIPPPYHQKVFDLFDRLDPHDEGSGAGLTIVKRVVEVHGGHIWIESEGLPGQGTTFCFTLPGIDPKH